jgi:mannitol/fructose-specific phosphotransferase system IIA component (Ntr-type)
MAGTLSDLLAENQITLDLREQSQTGALRELVNLFASNSAVHDLDGFYEALMAREQATSTVVGNGVAFPHARTDHVDKIVLAAGRSIQGVQFGSNPEPVHLIFVIGTPKALISDYLVCVGSLARFVKSKATCEKLMAAKTSAEFIDILKGKA